MKFQNTTKIILAVFLICTSIISIAQPDWSVDPNEYLYSMTITGKLKINRDFSSNENDKIAAFIDGECRGVASVKYQPTLDEYLVFIMIFSNDPVGAISFEIYDSQQDSVNFTSETANFEINDIIGSVVNPFIFTASTDPPGTYSDQAKIISFSLPNQIGVTSFSGNILLVELSSGSNLAGILSNFTLSSGANAFVRGKEVKSGITPLSYYSRVEFVTVSEDLKVSESYFIDVILEGSTLLDIELSKNEIAENSSSLFVGNLKAIFDGLQSNYEINLVSTLNDDEANFYLVDSLLFAKSIFNYEEKSSYNIRIKAADSKGGIREKEFEIVVLDMNDPPTDITISKQTIYKSSKANSLVAKLDAIDEDLADLHNYFLLEGDGENDKENDYFQIVGDSLVLLKPVINEVGNIFKILIGVEDSSGLTTEKSVEFQIVDVNNAPEIISTPTSYVLQNEVYVYMLQATDTNGDNISFSFENLPDWLSFNPNSELLFGVAGNSGVGDYSFNIIASDGDKETIQPVSLTVINVNDPPEINYFLNQQYFFTNSENELQIPTGIFTDPDVGDMLTYKISSENNSVLPDWLNFDPVTLKLTGNPPDDLYGTYGLKLTATDKGNLSEWIVFYLNVTYPTSLDDLDDLKSFNIYPNPIHDELNISIPSGTDDAIITISDLNGRLVRNIKLGAGTQNKLLLDDILSGIYFITLRQNDIIQVKKIVKL
ncbi:MAG: T9SS type A sorting domain-containing protein [Draconibacterium sp.]|nr:T9SS type A sorting domain-containing protein [Draconibacterium sp.]